MPNPKPIFEEIRRQLINDGIRVEPLSHPLVKAIKRLVEKE